MTDEPADVVTALLDTAEDGVLPIVAIGHPVLRGPTVPVPESLWGTAVLARLIEVMRATMLDAPGVGLAAPQIGLPLRLAVVEDDSDRHESMDGELLAVRERAPLPFAVLADPTWAPLPAGPPTVAHFEGCLSVPGLTGVVRRYRRVLLRARDADGTPYVRDLEGWPARIVQHEVDHLDGTVYLDRVVTRSLSSEGEYVRRWAAPDPSRAAAGLGF